MIRALTAAIILSMTLAPAQTNQPQAKLVGAPTYSELQKAPKKASVRQNPLEKDSGAVPAGAKLFVLHCAECHGPMAQGGKKAPSLLADEVQHASPGTLFWLLTNGVVRRGMPVWSKLPEAQRWQLVAYIKALRPLEKTPSVPAPHDQQN
jgi:mono/diheme cytochrome c family protein